MKQRIGSRMQEVALLVKGEPGLTRYGIICKSPILSHWRLSRAYAVVNRAIDAGLVCVDTSGRYETLYPVLW